MQRKLTAKVQKLSPKLPQAADSFSNTLVITPDSEDLLNSKGVLYAVFDTSGKESMDPLLVTKIVNDVLHDSYYQSESTSPIQSLEKAVVDVCGKVTNLSRGSASSEDFNILVVALWGNVLYLVQYGKGGSFLVRSGEIKPINSASEGNFSVASGIVKDDDVVFLATESFLKSYSPQDLLNVAASISPYDLGKRASCLLLKFEVTATFGEEEKIDFGLGDVEKPGKTTPVLGRSLGRSPFISKGKIEMKLKFPKKVGTKRPFVVIAAIAAILLAGSIYFTLSRKGGEEEVIDEDTKGVVESVISDAKGLDEAFIEEFKVQLVSPEVFYDIKIENENVSPDFIAVVDNHVVVVDSSVGNMYVSGVNIPSFSAEGSTFPRVRYLAYFGGDVAFVDEEGYKVYDVVNGEVKETYLLESLGLTSNYLDFVYSVGGDKILKYEKLANSLDGGIWGQSSDFEGAVSMAIDGSIYVLTKEGNLYSYTSGQKDDFEVKGLDKPFSSPKQVVTDFDLDMIYVVDAGNSRIVVLNKGGELVKQILAENNAWDDIRGVGVARDEETIFVLSRSKVYKVGL